MTIFLGVTPILQRVTNQLAVPVGAATIYYQLLNEFFSSPSDSVAVTVFAEVGQGNGFSQVDESSFVGGLLGSRSGAAPSVEVSLPEGATRIRLQVDRVSGSPTLGLQGEMRAA